jgi:predicted GTPase
MHLFNDRCSNKLVNIVLEGEAFAGKSSKLNCLHQDLNLEKQESYFLLVASDLLVLTVSMTEN